MLRLIRRLLVAALVLQAFTAVAQDPGAAPRLLGPTVAAPLAFAARAADTATITRDRAVRPDVAAVDAMARRHVATSRPERFFLDLFPGLDLEATVIGAEVRTNGSTLFAKLDVELGSAVLTYESGILIAAVDMPSGNYTVEHAAGDVYRVAQRALQFAPPEKEPLLVFTPPPAAFDVESDVPLDSGRLIDVMIVWTATAQSANGGLAAMQALAQASIDNANLTYLNSGVAQRLRLVHRQQVAYTETTSCGSDAFTCALNAATNGSISGLHALRDQHGADLVSLYIDDAAYCGLAWLPFPSAATAGQGYSVVDGGCAVGNKSFVHELGHNMGAHHDPFVLSNDPGDGCADGKERGAYCYSRGYVNVVQGWRTVLAYVNQCGNCPRIQFLSNPRLTNGGVALGTGTLHNNAHSLNKTAKAIAAYRATSALHPVPQRFTDVALGSSTFGHVEFLAQAGITSGCATGLYCPNDSITRRHMAAFVERTLRASNWTAPAPTGLFTDVATGSQFSSYVEAMFADGITSGCAASPLRYCPEDVVTRAQMAVFVLRAKCGATYVPNAPAVATFSDVPTSHPQFRYIEKLATLGITGGCASGPLRYCPTSPVSRAQMAVFIERAFPFSVPTEVCTL